MEEKIIVRVDDLRREYYSASIAGQLSDYRDSSTYIDDAIHEIADAETPIYYSGMLQFLTDGGVEYIEQAIAEGLYNIDAKTFDFWGLVQAGAYIYNLRILYNDLPAGLYTAALDFIQYDEKRDEIPEELADLLDEWTDEADTLERMDEIPDRIREYFEDEEEDEDEEDEEDEDEEDKIDG